jgi:hypothetical protein
VTALMAALLWACRPENEGWNNRNFVNSFFVAWWHTCV